MTTLSNTVRAGIEKPTLQELQVERPGHPKMEPAFGNNWNDPAFHSSHRKRQLLRSEQTGVLPKTHTVTVVNAPPVKPNVTCHSAAALLETIQSTRAAVVQGLHGPPVQTTDDDRGSIDDKVLRFYAFTTEPIRESAVEKVRTRIVSISFFLIDDTVLIQQKHTSNSGITGGTLLKRQRLPIARDDADRREADQVPHITLTDLRVGHSINLLGQRYFIFACDGFTREFLIAIGAEPEQDGPEPEDEYFTHYRAGRIDFKNKTKSFETKDLSATLESLASKGQSAQHYPEETLRIQRFVRDSGKVLSFMSLWNDEDSGVLRTLELRFYVEDDTISLVERPNPVTQRETTHRALLSRRRVPVSGKASKQVELTFANRVNGQREHFLGTEDRYYDVKDLVIGAELNVFGRMIKLYDCDGYTRSFMTEAGIDVGQPIDISNLFPKRKVYETIVAPHTGFGTYEDSLASCSLTLKPPKKDLRGFHEFGGECLRYEMKLSNPEPPEDSLRRFILTFYLADGEIQVTEVAGRNTGFTGGRFMKKSKVERHKGQRDFYTAADLQVGATVNIQGFNFVLLRRDEHSDRLMEFASTKGRDPRDLDRVSPERLEQLVAKFREFVQVRFYTNTEAFRAFDRDHDGFVSLSEMMEGLKANLITDREEEAAAMVQLFDHEGLGKVSYKDFMEAVAVHKDPVLPKEAMRVASENCKMQAKSAEDLVKRRAILRALHDRFESRCLNVYEAFRMLSTMPRAYRGPQTVELAALTNCNKDTVFTPVQLRRALNEVLGMGLNDDETAVVLHFFFPGLPPSEYHAQADRTTQYAVRLPEFQQQMVLMSAVRNL